MPKHGAILKVRTGKEEINVSGDFIQHNYTPYEGMNLFADATPALITAL